MCMGVTLFLDAAHEVTLVVSLFLSCDEKTRKIYILYHFTGVRLWEVGNGDGLLWVNGWSFSVFDTPWTTCDVGLGFVLLD